MGFSLLGDSDEVASVSTDFASNSKGDPPFQQTACKYSHAHWDSLGDHLRDVPWQDIFELGTSAAVTVFSAWNQTGTDVYIHHKYYQSFPH